MTSGPAFQSELPLFPLKMPLFPGLKLSLKVFEPRYLRMLADCFKQGTSFGIVALKSGNEVGADQETFSYGVRVDIVDWDQLDNGLLSIEVLGRERFKILAEPKRVDGLLVAEVDWLGESEATPIPDFVDGLTQLLSELTGHPMAEHFGASGPAHDVESLTWRLLQFAPIPLASKISLMSENDPLARLDKLQLEIDRLAAS